MGWVKDLKKKVKKVKDKADDAAGFSISDLDITDDLIDILDDTVDETITKPAEDVVEKVEGSDLDLEDLVSEDPEAVFDALNDAAVLAADEGGGDVADLQGSIEDIRENNPDFDVEDFFNPEELAHLTDDVIKEAEDGFENIIDASGNTKENFQDLFGDELGGYLYETQLTAGNITPLSEEDFQHGGDEDLFGEDGDIINLNEELQGAIGGDTAEETEAAAQNQIDSSREALGLLRGDLAPFKDILSGDQLSDLSQLSTNQGAQTRFLNDNALLDQIRGDVNEASFRSDSVASQLDKSGRKTGGVRGVPGQDGFTTPLNIGQSSGASTNDMIDKIFLRAGNDLINQQINRQLPLLSTGQNSAAQAATGSANLLTGAGNAAAAGTIGAANAQQQGAQNTVGLVSTIASLFSDERLKENITVVDTFNGLNVCSWDWNEKAKALGLEGSGFGHIAQEVKGVYPELVGERDGYFVINYTTDKTVN